MFYNIKILKLIVFLCILYFKKIVFLGQEVLEMLIDIDCFFYLNLLQFRLDLESIFFFSLKKFFEIKVKLFVLYFNFKK